MAKSRILRNIMISGEMKKTWWMIEAHSLISVLYWLLTAYRSASSPSIAKERTVLSSRTISLVLATTCSPTCGK